MAEACVIFISYRHASWKFCIWQTTPVWCTYCYTTELSRPIDLDELGKLKKKWLYKLWLLFMIMPLDYTKRCLNISDLIGSMVQHGFWSSEDCFLKKCKPNQLSYTLSSVTPPLPPSKRQRIIWENLCLNPHPCGWPMPFYRLSFWSLV